MDTYTIFGNINTADIDDSDKIKSIYKSRESLIKGILSMYRFMFNDEKEIWQKTTNDVRDDVVNSKYDLDIKIEPYKNLDELFNQKTRMVPALIDFCYIYYVTHYNKDAPLYKLPSKLKFKLITYVLHCKDTTADKAIQEAFMLIIDDPLFTELRDEEIPFYISSSLSIDEQRNIFEKNIKPVINDIICNLLRLQ